LLRVTVFCHFDVHAPQLFALGVSR